MFELIRKYKTTKNTKISKILLSINTNYIKAYPSELTKENINTTKFTLFRKEKSIDRGIE